MVGSTLSFDPSLAGTFYKRRSPPPLHDYDAHACHWCFFGCISVYSSEERTWSAPGTLLGYAIVCRTNIIPCHIIGGCLVPCMAMNRQMHLERAEPDANAPRHPSRPSATDTQMPSRTWASARGWPPGTSQTVRNEARDGRTRIYDWREQRSPHEAI